MTRPPSPRLYCRFPGRQRRFDDPIPLPGGGQFVTLKDAADYILALPAKASAQEHWQLAMQMLIDAADRGGIVMLARIAMMQALNHGKPDPATPVRRGRAKAYRVIK